MLIAAGEEMQQFKNEMNNPRYGILCTAAVDLDEADPEELQRDIASLIEREQVQIVVVDLYHEKAQAMVSSLYTFLFSQVVEHREQILQTLSPSYPHLPCYGIAVRSNHHHVLCN